MTGALRFQVHPALDDPVLVLAFGGWSDAGEAASSALAFLNDAIQSVALAELDPEDFYDFTVARPHVELSPEGERRIVWPSTEFRFGHLGSIELVTGLGSEPHLRWRSFCDAVASLAEGIHAHRVVLLGSFLSDVVYSRPVEVTGFASDPRELERIGVGISSYEGPTNIVGVLGDRLQRDGCEVIALWACLPHYLSTSPNPRGSLALLDKLSAYLGVPIDDRELRTEAEDFEKRVNEIVASDPELSEYVRQLKKRDFAQ